MAIVTLEQAKRQLNIPAANTDNDAELQEYIDGLAGAIADHLHEVVELREISERLRLTGRSRFRLWRVPVVELVSLVDRATGASVDVDGMDVDGGTGLVEVLSGPAPRGVFTATYRAGYDDVPSNYVRGALVILQHVWQTQRGTQGTIAGQVGGDENYDPRYSYSIPRRALEWLGPPRPGVG